MKLCTNLRAEIKDKDLESKIPPVQLKDLVSYSTPPAVKRKGINPPPKKATILNLTVGSARWFVLNTHNRELLAKLIGTETKERRLKLFMSRISGTVDRKWYRNFFLKVLLITSVYVMLIFHEWDNRLEIRNREVSYRKCSSTQT